jgi:hypothetical protein
LITFKQLSTEQRARLTQAAYEKGESVETYLKDLSPDPFLKGAIQGMLPHCGLWGLMEEDGTCHT